MAAGPRTAADLATATATDQDALGRLLRALGSLGIVRREPGGAFALTDVGGLLRSDAPGSLRAAAELTGAAWRAAALDLESCVRDGGSAFARRFGQPLYPYLAAHPDEARAFHAVQQGHAAALDLLPAVDASAAGVVVDVGGGTGAVLARILSARPGLRGVLFDRPEVVAQAGPVLAAASVDERCGCHGGDFLEAVPAGGDLYLLCFVLHNWDDAGAARILGACAAAMAPGARLLVVEGLLGDDTAQLHLLDLEMLVFTEGGRERTEAEYRALLGGAGLAVLSVGPSGASAAVIAAASAAVSAATGAPAESSGAATGPR